jgi:spore germination protein GerM
MKQMNPKTLAAAVVAGAVAVGVSTTMLVNKPSVKVSVEIDPNKNSAPITSTSQPATSEAPIATNSNPTASTPANGTTSPVVKPIPVPENNVNVYKVDSTAKGIKVVPSNIPVKAPTKSAEENLRSAFGELLNNKSSAKNAKEVSAIPKGTRLLSLKTAANGIYVDLSKEFEQGGGTNSMQSRLLQVVYTATTFEPTAEVFLTIEGKKLETLGGEGIEVPSPLTRQSIKASSDSLKQNP